MRAGQIIVRYIESQYISEEVNHQSNMKILMFVVLFLLIGAFFIISNENIRLNTKENVNYFFKEYGKWADDLLSNGKTVAGYVVKMEWLPEKGETSPS